MMSDEEAAARSKMQVSSPPPSSIVRLQLEVPEVLATTVAQPDRLPANEGRTERWAKLRPQPSDLSTGNCLTIESDVPRIQL